MEPSSVWIKAHQLEGQICHSRPSNSSQPCREPATWVGFGVKQVAGKPTTDVNFFFLCDEHVVKEEKCSECPHTSQSERFAQLIAAGLDIKVAGVWPIFDLVEETVLLTFKNPNEVEADA